MSDDSNKDGFEGYSLDQRLRWEEILGQYEAIRAEQNRHRDEFHKGFILQYSTSAIKSGLTINGGAAVAILAFARDSGAQSLLFAEALQWFSYGALLSVFAYGMSYVSQCLYFDCEGPKSRGGDVLRYLAMLAVLVMAVTFVVGVGRAKCALIQNDQKKIEEPVTPK